jgi:hypothetical protein
MTTPPIQTLTDELLADIENEARMATSGLWEALDSPVGELYVAGPCDELICGAIDHVHDANLIAHMSPDNVIALITELRTLRAENAELRKDAAVARDHLISARHDVEYRSQYGSEAARLVLAGIDQYLGDIAMEQAK